MKKRFPVTSVLRASMATPARWLSVPFSSLCKASPKRDMPSASVENGRHPEGEAEVSTGKRWEKHYQG